MLEFNRTFKFHLNANSVDVNKSWKRLDFPTTKVFVENHMVENALVRDMFIDSISKKTLPRK